MWVSCSAGAEGLETSVPPRSSRSVPSCTAHLRTGTALTWPPRVQFPTGPLPLLGEQRWTSPHSDHCVAFRCHHVLCPRYSRQSQVSLLLRPFCLPRRVRHVRIGLVPASSCVLLLMSLCPSHTVCAAPMPGPLAAARRPSHTCSMFPLRLCLHGLWSASLTHCVAVLLARVHH